MWHCKEEGRKENDICLSIRTMTRNVGRTITIVVTLGCHPQEVFSRNHGRQANQHKGKQRKLSLRSVACMSDCLNLNHLQPRKCNYKHIHKQMYQFTKMLLTGSILVCLCFGSVDIIPNLSGMCSLLSRLMCVD